VERLNQVAIIFGRFNPPHKGHKNAWHVASKFPHWYIGTNKSTAGLKDPLPYKVKVQCMETIMPEARGHIVADTSWLTMATTVFNQHGKVELFCCTDEAWVVPALQKYNGVEGAHGFYQFGAIHQKATPRLASATDLRAAVERNDPAAFAQAAGVPADTPVGKHTFFNLVRHYLMPYVEEEAAKQLNTKVPKEKVMKKGPAKTLAEARPYGDYFDDSGISARPGHDEGETVYDPRYDRIGAGDPNSQRHHHSNHSRSDAKPELLYMFKYDVRPGEEQKAIDNGLTQTKNGNWVIKVYNLSKPKSYHYKVQSADSWMRSLKRSPGKRIWMTKDPRWDQMKSHYAQVDKQRLAEGSMDELHSDLSDKYNELAPRIQKHKDKAGAEHLYKELEAVAKKHGHHGLRAFTHMCNGARNSAHMDYDTNPGGFENWFWYLGLEDKGITESKTKKAEAPKPRNFVAKNAINSGAGAHKDKKKAMKQGEQKHKKSMPMFEGSLASALDSMFTDRFHASLKEAVLRADTQHAMPNMRVHPDLDNSSPYKAYRYGVAMAGAPSQDFDPNGPIGQKMITVGYTEADDNIVRGADKIMKSRSKAITSKGSKELEDTNTTSPIAKVKRNKYGV